MYFKFCIAFFLLKCLLIHFESKVSYFLTPAITNFLHKKAPQRGANLSPSL